MRLIDVPLEKKKLKEKPWLTKGPLKSIKQKNKMYKKFFDHSNFQIVHYIPNTKNIVTFSIEH